MNVRAAAVAALALGLLAGACSADAQSGSDCEPTVDPEHSVARLFIVAVLSGIVSDFTAPTLHARNLYHSTA